MMKALIAVLACGLVSACTSGELTVPEPVSVTEVTPPTTGIASSSGGSAELGALPMGVQVADPNVSTAVAAPGVGRKLDTDTLNLMQTTLEEQKIDAAVAEQKLASDRAQLVVIQPGRLPDRVNGVNIALYAKQTTNAVGTRIYDRTGMGGLSSGCRKFSSADDAQRAFLAAGGPQSDQYGLDSDGDGFACAWDPTPYRQL